MMTNEEKSDAIEKMANEEAARFGCETGGAGRWRGGPGDPNDGRWYAAFRLDGPRGLMYAYAGEPQSGLDGMRDEIVRVLKELRSRVLIPADVPIVGVLDRCPHEEHIGKVLGINRVTWTVHCEDGEHEMPERVAMWSEQDQAYVIWQRPNEEVVL